MVYSREFVCSITIVIDKFSNKGLTYFQILSGEELLAVEELSIIQYKKFTSSNLRFLKKNMES